jgi:hypothetical protein
VDTTYKPFDNLCRSAQRKRAHSCFETLHDCTNEIIDAFAYSQNISPEKTRGMLADKFIDPNASRLSVPAAIQLGVSTRRRLHSVSR